MVILPPTGVHIGGSHIIALPSWPTDEESVEKQLLQTLLTYLAERCRLHAFDAIKSVAFSHMIGALSAMSAC